MFEGRDTAVVQLAGTFFIQSLPHLVDAALEAGLSGAGRLHDLCVNLEAASPGEWKSGGEGWTLTHGFAASPFGRCLIAESPRGICHLSFVSSDDATEMRAFREIWPQARFQRDNPAASTLAARVFAAEPALSRRPPLRAFVLGTPFQVRVWRARASTLTP